MLKTEKSLIRWYWRCVLSFLWKLVRGEISLMSEGIAFQARGPAMEKALSATWSQVREFETTKLPYAQDRRRVSSQFLSVTGCFTVT